MSKNPETKVKEEFIKEWKKNYTSCWIEKIQQASIRGTPDLLGTVPCDICERGLFCAVELKTKKGRLTPLQKLKGEQITNTGGLFMVYKEKSDMSQLVEWEQNVQLSLLLENLVKKYGENKIWDCLDTLTGGNLRK